MWSSEDEYDDEYDEYDDNDEYDVDEYDVDSLVRGTVNIINILIKVRRKYRRE